MRSGIGATVGAATEAEEVGSAAVAGALAVEEDAAEEAESDILLDSTLSSWERVERELRQQHYSY